MNEITTLNNPRAADALSKVETTLADYVIVYFSGHGFTDRRSNSRMVAFKDGHLPDWCLLNASPRQLVIVDACRNFLTPGLGNLPSFEESVDHFESISTYEIFNQYIANSLSGKMVVHATQPGKYSYDSLSGGIFTQALINVSSRMKTNHMYGPCSIRSVLYHVPRVLQSVQIEQSPAITYMSGSLSVPFALGSIASRVRAIRQKDSSGQALGALVLTLAVVGFVAAISS